MRPVSRRAATSSRVCAALAIALTILAACQPPPRPFAPTDRSGGVPFTPAADAYGIALRPVSGMPPALAAAFVPALIEALARREVPAVVSSERAPGALVYGAAEARPADDGRLEVAIEWWVIGRDGRGLGRHWVSAGPLEHDWEGASEPLVRRLASESADGIASLLRPAPPAPVRKSPSVRFGAVAAPRGIDGNALRRAMIGAMRAAGIDILPDGRAGPLLTATISLGPVVGGMRPLGVEWRLEDESGERIGALVQGNDVVNETLIADWPEVVRLIARAATGELHILLERAARKVSVRPVDGAPRRP